VHEYEGDPTMVLTTRSGNQLLRRGEKRKVDDAHWAGSWPVAPNRGRENWAF
jgi:hypothetical protein